MECKKSGVSWILTTENRDNMRAIVNSAMEFPFCMKGGKLLTSWPSIAFSDRILLVGIGLNFTSYLAS